MPDVKNSAAGARDQPGHDHALDHQVRDVFHDEAILDGAGFALIGVADNVFLFARSIAHDLPLAAGRETGAAHAAQPAGFQGGDDAAPIRVLDKLPDHRILGIAAIRIGGDTHTIGRPMLVVLFRRKLSPGEHVPHQPNGAIFVEVAIDLIVDRERGRLVAAAETGHIYAPQSVPGHLRERPGRGRVSGRDRHASGKPYRRRRALRPEPVA